MLLLMLGGILIGAATILDSIFRIRMTRIGQRKALLQGGAFNYSEYQRVRGLYGWAAWPVYLMWVLVLCGITLLIVGFFAKFGTHPLPHNAVQP